jgi:hypothetical protein
MYSLLLNLVNTNIEFILYLPNMSVENSLVYVQSCNFTFILATYSFNDGTVL